MMSTMDDDDDEDGAEARVGKLVESSIIIQGSWRAEDGAEARVGMVLKLSGSAKRR